LGEMRGPDGESLDNRVLTPGQLYPVVNGIAPDLMVYFGDLHWRSLGEVGGDSVLTDTNDIGPDDANHAMEGLVILSDGSISNTTKLEGAKLIDIAPTVLSWMGVPVPESMQGRILGS
jgi:predicted AlkP superfamily phosphohydrolase/phosphomutase